MAKDRFDEVASRVVTRVSWFDKTILRRDLMETGAAIFVILGFGLFFVFLPAWPWMARLGVAIIILGAMEIIVVLHWTRRRGRQRRDLPLTQFCVAEIARVDQQIWLLRHINWWYTGPTLLGCFLFAFGFLISLGGPTPLSIGTLVFCYAVFLFLGGFTYHINQRAVREELMPLREELADIYDSLEDDSSETGLGG